MDKTKVTHTFCIYTGIETTETLEYDDILNLAMAEASSMLRPDADIIGDDTQICYLAGVLAFYRYALIKQASSADEVKLGDVTIKSNTSHILNTAITAKSDAIALCHDILTDNFYFSGTAS